MSALSAATFCDETAQWSFAADPASLAIDLQEILCGGGDSRLDIDPLNRRNQYFSAASPQSDEISFSSTTASTISAAAFAACAQLQEKLLAANKNGDQQKTYRENFALLNSRLASFLHIAVGDAEFILTNSGTETEYYAAALARTAADRRLVNIVIAPDETGSGVVKAAGGRYFNSRTAAGDRVVADQLVDPALAGMIQVEAINIRHDNGTLLSETDIEDRISSIITRAIASDADILVHFLEGSKTGLQRPHYRFLEQLRDRYSDRISILVDFCQMRQPIARVQDYLDRDCMVAITGSKFYGGPPFSGALLVPAAIAGRANQCPPLPANFAKFTLREAWPAHWDRFCQAIPSRVNYGLLFRWHAALCEMECIAALDVAAMAAILQALCGQLAAAAGAAAFVIPITNDSSNDHLTDWPPTILSFAVAYAGKRLQMPELKRVYQLLTEDLSRALSHETPAIAQRCCHIGQPVKLGVKDNEDIAVLRISLSARHVARVIAGDASPEQQTQRIAAIGDEARLVFAKLTLIGKYWHRLRAA